MVFLDIVMLPNNGPIGQNITRRYVSYSSSDGEVGYVRLELVNLRISNFVCWWAAVHARYIRRNVRTTGMCSGSRDLFKFWEISDNISLTVQEKDIVCCNETLIRNRMWPIEWHHCQCPWMTSKVTFAVWNLSCSYTSWTLARIY